MAIDPNMYQNVYTTSTTGVGQAIGGSPYYNINIDTTFSGPSSRLFANNSSVSNPYYPEDVTDEFLRKLHVYTDAMLIGDIKTVTTEYLWAVNMALKVLRQAKHPLSSARIERYWKEATEMKGSLPEDFARLIQDSLTK